MKIQFQQVSSARSPHAKVVALVDGIKVTWKVRTERYYGPYQRPRIVGWYCSEDGVQGEEACDHVLAIEDLLDEAILEKLDALEAQG